MKLLAEMVVFAKVVDHNGFAAAGRHLGMTASAVSRCVGRLETHLGVRLLNRTTRSLSLTEMGSDVYADCARIAGAARDVEAQAGRYAAYPTGTVRITAPMVYGDIWLARQLPAFLIQWPEVKIEIEMTDRLVDLVEDGFDLAIRVAVAGTLAPGLVARPLCNVAYAIVATPAYLLEHGTPAEPAHLASHRCIQMGYGTLRNQLAMRRAGEELVVEIDGPLKVNSSMARLAVVEGGVGIGIIPNFIAAPAVKSGTLVRLFPDWELIGGYTERTVHAVYPPTHHLPKKVRALIDHLVNTSSA
ncbi:LysR family transcriptional regulator [Pseudoduganella sp. LjRoot289]|uniref:LysR family transcriptional regulator n=1 Tax=Pseudoduganella sp. LjRoot289 TaxID=3342314 RepID=UPI003ECFA6FC